MERKVATVALCLGGAATLTVAVLYALQVIESPAPIVIMSIGALVAVLVALRAYP